MIRSLFFALLVFLYITGCGTRGGQNVEINPDMEAESGPESWICGTVGESTQWLCADSETKLIQLMRETGQQSSTPATAGRQVPDSPPKVPLTETQKEQEEDSELVFSQSSQSTATKNEGSDVRSGDIVGAWIVQVASFRTKDRATTFMQSNSMYEFEHFEVTVQGVDYHTIVLKGRYPTFEDAVKASETLVLRDSSSDPWVRTFASLQTNLNER